jgi:hypothetical protein
VLTENTQEARQGRHQMVPEPVLVDGPDRPVVPHRPQAQVLAVGDHRKFMRQQIAGVRDDADRDAPRRAISAARQRGGGMGKGPERQLGGHRALPGVGLGRSAGEKAGEAAAGGPGRSCYAGESEDEAVKAARGGGHDARAQLG